MDEYFCPNCGAILNDQYGFALMVGYGDVQSVVSSLWMMMFITEIRLKE